MIKTEKEIMNLSSDELIEYKQLLRREGKNLLDYIHKLSNCNKILNYAMSKKMETINNYLEHLEQRRLDGEDLDYQDPVH